MASDNSLVKLYQRWLELAEEEGCALREGNWDVLRRCAAGKDEIFQSVRSLEAALPQPRPPLPEDLRQLIHRLEGLESRNLALARERSAEIRGRQDDLDRRSRWMRQLQGQYEGAAEDRRQVSHQA